MALQNLYKWNMIECYIESGKNKVVASNLYFQKYPERSQPDCRIFERLQYNLCEYGSFVKPRPKAYIKENQENEEINTIAYVSAKPEASSREIENNLGICQKKTLKILKRHRFRPYKIRKVHDLHPGDDERRIIYCQWYLQKCHQNPNFHEKVIWTDEAYISSDGIFNRNNTIYWSDINPHETVARVQQGKFGFSVWVALFGGRIWGYRIYDENLNTDLYVQILEENIIRPLDDMPLAETADIFFQNDGAPAHNGRAVATLLNHNFRENWMGTNGPIRWPPRSPDLTPLDFFFWGYLKNDIYKNRSNNIQELRQNFENSIQNVPNLCILNATRTIRKRCEKNLEQNGRQFEHLL